ncbi:MAG: ABC transporter permease subunit [Patescibacteria group bacterium]
MKEQRNSVAVYIASLVGYTFLMISMFPSMKKMDIDALISSYPEDFAKFFGDSGMASFGTIEGFLSMEFFSLFFILITSFYIGSAAGSAIAGQIEKRTMDFNLSQPISRTKLVLAEAITALFYSSLITVFVSSFTYLFCILFDVAISAKGIANFTVIATLLIWALYGIGLFLSSILKSKIGVMLLTVAFTLGSYVFLSLTRLVEKLQNLDMYSIFYLYDPEKLLRNTGFEYYQIYVLLGVFALGLAGSLIVFNRKDV